MCDGGQQGLALQSLRCESCSASYWLEVLSQSLPLSEPVFICNMGVDRAKKGCPN